MNAREKYADIIDKEHHVSDKRGRMGRLERAAQFSPFAALTGYDDAVVETGRLTSERVVLDEDKKNILDYKFSLISEKIESRPYVTVTYFKPDLLKAGGEYEEYTGALKKIDNMSRELVFENDVRIAIDDIVECDEEGSQLREQGD